MLEGIIAAGVVIVVVAGAWCLCKSAADADKNKR
jgi:hypothetical protein